MPESAGSQLEVVSRQHRPHPPLAGFNVVDPAPLADPSSLRGLGSLCDAVFLGADEVCILPGLCAHGLARMVLTYGRKAGRLLDSAGCPALGEPPELDRRRGKQR